MQCWLGCSKNQQRPSLWACDKLAVDDVVLVPGLEPITARYPVRRAGCVALVGEGREREGFGSSPLASQRRRPSAQVVEQDEGTWVGEKGSTALCSGCQACAVGPGRAWLGFVLVMTSE